MIAIDRSRSFRFNLAEPLVEFGLREVAFNPAESPVWTAEERRSRSIGCFSRVPVAVVSVDGVKCVHVFRTLRERRGKNIA